MKKISLLLFIIACFVVTNGYAKKTSSRNNYTPPLTSRLPMYVKYDHGLIFSTKDNLIQTKINGYIQADGMKFTGNPGNLLNSGTNIRRARFGISGRFLHDWGYNFLYDFANNSLKNAFISYTGWKNILLVVGQFSPDFSLSNYASTNDITFLETSLPVNALSPPYYNQGVLFNINNNVLSLNIDIFGPSSQETTTGRNPFSTTARLVYAPIHSNGRVIHLGFSEWFHRPDGSNSTSVATNPEARSHNGDTLINTGTINNVDNYNVIALEAAGLIGSWSAQAEYLADHITRQNGARNLNFGGYYLTTSYFLTGETRTYEFPAGIFGPISPIRHKYGAWQVAARFSTLNLNDNDIRGGKEKNATLGVNWYPNRFVEFKLNYIRAMAHPASDGQDRNVNIFALRTQVVL